MSAAARPAPTDSERLDLMLERNVILFHPTSWDKTFRIMKFEPLTCDYTCLGIGKTARAAVDAAIKTRKAGR